MDEKNLHMVLIIVAIVAIIAIVAMVGYNVKITGYAITGTTLEPIIGVGDIPLSGGGPSYITPLSGGGPSYGGIDLEIINSWDRATLSAELSTRGWSLTEYNSVYGLTSIQQAMFNINPNKTQGMPLNAFLAMNQNAQINFLAAKNLDYNDMMQLVERNPILAQRILDRI